MKLYGNLHFTILNSLNLVSTMLAVSLLAAALGPNAFAAEGVIYTFRGGNDGIGSNDLIADRAGNLYGTTFNGVGIRWSRNSI